jgi:hypothetical protein
MLTGRFGNTSGRPYIEGRLSLPNLNLSANVSFVIDTGSDCTVLMPLDAMRINLDYSRLTKEVDSVGIGGICRDFAEPALVAFTDGIAVYIYEIELRIATASADIMAIPSLLGRDVINRWHISYSFPNNKIEIQNHTADNIVSIDHPEP